MNDEIWVDEAPPAPADDDAYYKWDAEWPLGSRIMLGKTQIGHADFHADMSEMTVAQLTIYDKFQRKGYGKKTIAELIKIAKREACTLIRTSTPAMKGTPADFMWQKSDFEVVREVTTDNGFIKRYFEKKLM